MMLSQDTTFIHEKSNKIYKFLTIFFYHQEARAAAEKAVTVVKVEERVNKAVASANRAANAARVAAVKAVQNQMHQDSHCNLRVLSII